MGTYNSFEDLPVWQSAKNLAILVYKLTSIDKLKKDYGIKDQIQRAAISVSSNIAEGFERGSKQELIQFLYISRGSCGELRSQLSILKDIEYINNQEYENLYIKCKEVSRQINGFIEYLKSSNIPGQKFLSKHNQEAKIFLEELKKYTNQK